LDSGVVKTLSASDVTLYQYGQDGMLFEEASYTGVPLTDYICLDGRPIAALISLAYFLRQVVHQKGALGFFLAFVRDPLFILAIAVLVVSTIDLDYMQYRLETSTSSNLLKATQATRHKIVPIEYKRIYGKDTFFYLWQIRPSCLIFFLLALLHWLKIWK